ncbi:MAG TPA: hypothetical protein PLA03_11375 [Acidobacteriota bacterium]|nr:hypothetical protein [Acidobacteriota bacterium]
MARNFYPVVLLVLLLAVFAPLFAGCNFLPFDAYPAYCEGMLVASGQTYEHAGTVNSREQEFGWFAVNIPNDVLFSTSLRKGVFPLWNPYYGCGAPTFDDGQFRPLNPFKLLFFIYPDYWTYCISLFLLLASGALFFNFWLKSKGLDELSSLVGSIAFSLNPWTLSRLAQSDSPAYLLSPLLFIVFDRLDLARPFRSACLLSLTLFLICSISHPEMFLLISLVGFLYYFSSGYNIRKIRFITTASPLFLGATCIYWLPPVIFSFSAFIYKNIIRYDYSYSLKDLLTSSSDMFLFPTLIFFLVAWLFGKRVFLFFKFVFAAGFLLIFLQIPFLDFSLASTVNRHFFIQAYYFKPFFWLAVSIAVASGFESFFNNTLDKWIRVAAVIILILSAGLEALLCFISGDLLPGVQLPLLGVVVVVSTVILIAYKGMFRPSLKILAAFMIVLPFLLPFSTESLRWNRAKMKLPDLLCKCKDDFSESRVVSIGFKPTYYLPPNWGSAFAMRQGEAVSALFQVDYFKLFHQSKFPFTTVVFDYPETVIFEQMGASFVIVPLKAPPLGGASSFPGYVKEASDNHITIYRLENGKGRFFLADKAEFESPGQNISKQIMDLGGRKDGYAVVRREGDKIPATLGNISSSGRIEVTLDEPERIALKVSTRDPAALLVVRDTFHSGWKARLNGRSADILRVNGCFRGLFLEKGTSKVEFYYRPASTIAALLVSIFSCLLCLAGATFSLKSRRNKPLEPLT